MGTCDLEPELNKCQYYVKEKKNCKLSSPGCGFFIPSEKKEPQANLRTPKWFEKYYK
ncbi:hypothetical protein [Lacrimispora sp. JR3]|uniref:hypothetical protein n=1 Tax=Lacrimispora sinapis TaxID=3111456 RepID=UPI003747BECC